MMATVVIPKRPWDSKTIWFNLVLGILGVLQSQGLLAQLPTSVLETAGAVGNILLRFTTTAPLAVRAR